MTNFSSLPSEVRRPLQARLSIDRNLPTELAHGIFAKPGTHEAVVRVAALPYPGMTIRFTSAPAEKIDLYAPHQHHPMDQEYTSRLPVRFGNGIAKFALVPSSPALLAVKSHPFSAGDSSALREAVRAFFEYNPAEFDLRIQLYSDADADPRTAAWLQDEPPYQTIGRLIIPAIACNPAITGLHTYAAA